MAGAGSRRGRAGGPGRAGDGWEVHHGGGDALGDGVGGRRGRVGGGEGGADGGGDVAGDEPGGVGPELEIVSLDGLGVAPKVPSLIPLQPLLILRPHVRRDTPHVELRVRCGRGDDVVHGGGDEAQGAVGREEAQGLDVQVLRARSAVVRVGGGLDAADDAADDFRFGAVVGPGDDARERVVDGALVEGVRVADGEEQRVDAAEGVDVVGGDGTDGGFAGEAVGGEGCDGDYLVFIVRALLLFFARGDILLLLSWYRSWRW